ncbi:hypothetical protein IH781_02435 [Patescibacteria group bacterium]|nr:hypothetical protein [Patescibacteria group bacterium]
MVMVAMLVLLPSLGTLLGAAIFSLSAGETSLPPEPVDQVNQQPRSDFLPDQYTQAETFCLTFIAACSSACQAGDQQNECLMQCEIDYGICLDETLLLDSTPGE